MQRGCPLVALCNVDDRLPDPTYRPPLPADVLQLIVDLVPVRLQYAPSQRTPLLSTAMAGRRARALLEKYNPARLQKIDSEPVPHAAANAAAARSTAAAVEQQASRR